MIAVLIILGIIIYFLIGYIVTRIFEELDVMDDLEDGLIFTIVMVFFPIVLIGFGIKKAGIAISDYIIKLIEKNDG